MVRGQRCALGNPKKTTFAIRFRFSDQAMIHLGRTTTMTALRETSVGFFLNESPHGDPADDILLPNKYVPRDLAVGDEIEVFVYNDSLERPVATTLRPAVQRDQFALLQAVAVSDAGAFLDWGLEKDLFVPFREQVRPMQEGRWYVVFAYLDDETNRLVASSRVNRYLQNDASDLVAGEEVQLLAYESTDLGLNVVVNNRYKGLVYHNEIFRTVRPGDSLVGYVKQIRDDNRVDVSLQRPGFENIEPNARRILAELRAEGGFLSLTDSSPPEEIYKSLEMSKKTFKKAIGTLYKDRKIVIEDNGIRLV